MAQVTLIKRTEKGVEKRVMQANENDLVLFKTKAHADYILGILESASPNPSGLQVIRLKDSCKLHAVNFAGMQLPGITYNKSLPIYRQSHIEELVVGVRCIKDFFLDGLNGPRRQEYWGYLEAVQKIERTGKVR